MALNNFVVIESEYGKLVVNRHCAYQAESLIKTGLPHIQSELDNILTIVRELPENCVVVDAGANIGLVAIPIAQTIRSRNGTVHAFEVQSMLFHAMCGSLALNDLENVVMHNQGLGATAGTLGIGKIDYAKPQDFGLFSLKSDETEPVSTVEVVTIDSLNLPRLDFLKIDVEGMEIDVLKGGRRTIERHVPWIWVEYWKVGIDAIKEHLAGLPYSFHVMDSLNLVCLPEGKLGSLRVATHSIGHGVAPDQVEELRRYRQAADQGEAYATHNVALFYQNGFGVPQDYAEAMRWYRKAAELGWPNAMTAIGFLYEMGWGTASDHAEAVRWWRKAAELGDDIAKRNLSLCNDG